MALTLLTACADSETKAIEAAAQGYLDAVGNYHFDEAIPYSSRKTREKTLPAFNLILAHSDTVYVNSNRPATITINKTRKLSDTTAWVYYHKSTPIKEVDDSVSVILEDGQWLVDVHIDYLPFMPDKMTDMSQMRRKNFKIDSNYINGKKSRHLRPLPHKKGSITKRK